MIRWIQISVKNFFDLIIVGNILSNQKWFMFVVVWKLGIFPSSRDLPNQIGHLMVEMNYRQNLWKKNFEGPSYSTIFEESLFENAIKSNFFGSGGMFFKIVEKSVSFQKHSSMTSFWNCCRILSNLLYNVAPSSSTIFENFRSPRVFGLSV